MSLLMSILARNTLISRDLESDQHPRCELMNWSDIRKLFYYKSIKQQFNVEIDFIKTVNIDDKIYTQSERFLNNCTKRAFLENATTNIPRIFYLFRPIFAVQCLQDFA